MLVYWLDIIGTAVFAISGVLLAGKLRMDPFGVLVLGVVTAVGGGTIRDMALANGPVFWVKDPTDLVVAMVTSMRDYSRRAGARNPDDSAYGNLRDRLHRWRYRTRNGALHLPGSVRKRGDVRDGGYAGDSAGGNPLAPEAANVCA